MTAVADLPTDVDEEDDEPIVITEPGVYDGIPHKAYLADPVLGGSLSHSGARKLLAPSCPALYRYEQTHPAAPKDHLEFGTAVHTLVFGTGTQPVLVDAPNWMSKKAQDQRKAVRESGAVALLPQEMEKASEMATVLRRHPVASKLIAPGTGKAEQSLFWRDERTGIWRRARLDWLPNGAPGKRMVAADYKTANAIDDEAISKAIHEHGYHTQDDWYTDGVRALGLTHDVALVFIFQMKSAPYLVRVVGVPETARAIAAAKNRRAIDIYAECRRKGRWPGFCDDDISYIDLPGWAETRDAMEYL